MLFSIAAARVGISTSRVRRARCSLHPPQHSLLPVLLVPAFPAVTMRPLILVLACVPFRAAEVEPLFLCVCCRLRVFLGPVSRPQVHVQVDCWRYFVVGELYEFLICFGCYPLLEVVFANISPHWLGCLAVSLSVLSALRKFLSLAYSSIHLLWLLLPLPLKPSSQNPV